MSVPGYWKDPSYLYGQSAILHKLLPKPPPVEVGFCVFETTAARPQGTARCTEALDQPTDLTSYHAAFDRNGAVLAANPWNLRLPDGSITTSDINAVVAQFGHSCARAP